MISYDQLPKDPVMLLSFINTQLRDHYRDLDAFLEDFQLDKEAILEKMALMDYAYDETSNQFI